MTDMKADKSEAISSLVTTIKDRILTVESKFLQHQFKYRKLEWIFKDESDDNVSSTSTNYIKFLMRFLKFIALFLDKYALNADGDVKGMFETAYSSLLKAHPDLKSLKKHSNLLESVPSNEEFKSLLRNPKNIKDCGKSVAESLIILTNRWHKLSNTPQNLTHSQKEGNHIMKIVGKSWTMIRIPRRQKRHWGVGEARVVAASSRDSMVAASSGDSMAAATSVGDVMVAASSGDSMAATTSVGDSTAGGGTNNQCVVVPTVKNLNQRDQSKKKKKKP
nr:hypothetical protein CFP56_40331 [Quercus suber]